MKKYLVAMNTGSNNICSTIVEMPDDYTPDKDNMKLLKQNVCRSYCPNSSNAHADMKNHGRVSWTSYDPIASKDLKIIAVSPLFI